jgi:hypothetical protein
VDGSYRLRFATMARKVAWPASQALWMNQIRPRHDKLKMIQHYKLMNCQHKKLKTAQHNKLRISRPWQDRRKNWLSPLSL